MANLTNEEIEAIRERAEYAESIEFHHGVITEIIEEDIPKLLAEIDRLTADVHRLEIENKTLEKVATKQTIKIERESDFDYFIGV